MKVIFLDFDGVLNTSVWRMLHGTGRFEHRTPMLQHELVKNFADALLVAQPKAVKIIFSTSWRYSLNEVQMAKCLVDAGFPMELTPCISGHTPQYLRGPETGCPVPFKTRGEEIVAWARRNPGDNQLIIIDDDLTAFIHPGIQAFDLYLDQEEGFTEACRDVLTDLLKA